jgi:hypothetical protein
MHRLDLTDAKCQRFAPSGHPLKRCSFSGAVGGSLHSYKLQRPGGHPRGSAHDTCRLMSETRAPWKFGGFRHAARPRTDRPSHPVPARPGPAAAATRRAARGIGPDPRPPSVAGLGGMDGEAPDGGGFRPGRCGTSPKLTVRRRMAPNRGRRTGGWPMGPADGAAWPGSAGLGVAIGREPTGRRRRAPKTCHEVPRGVGSRAADRSGDVARGPLPSQIRVLISLAGSDQDRRPAR